MFDWTFDGPVDRITQNRDTIVLEYGQFGLKRTIYMNLKEHPHNIKPSRAGTLDRALGRGHAGGRYCGIPAGVSEYARAE